MVSLDLFGLTELQISSTMLSPVATVTVVSVANATGITHRSVTEEQ